MQDLIKRYFWVVGAVTVMLCAVFAAKATGHVVEAKYLGDPEHAIKMMATVGGSLDERNDPGSIAGAKKFCLGDAVKQAGEKVQTYLEGVR